MKSKQNLILSLPLLDLKTKWYLSIEDLVAIESTYNKIRVNNYIRVIIGLINRFSRHFINVHNL